jgi:hypothetical protein
MEAGIYKELVKQNLIDYLEVKKVLPEDIDEVPNSDLKRFIKPGVRTFEEVY